MTAEADSYDRWTAPLSPRRFLATTQPPSPDARHSLIPIPIVSGILNGRGYIQIPWTDRAYTVEKAADLIESYIFQEAHEIFVQLLLDDSRRIVGLVRLSTGVHNRTLIDCDEFWATPALARVQSVVLGHNHGIAPLEPSEFDLTMTQEFAREGRKRWHIQVYDHLITGCQPGEYFSFRQNRLLGRRRLSANPWASPAVAAGRASPAPPGGDGRGGASIVA